MSKYKSPINLPDGHMRLVGIIAAHWESVNLVLDGFVAFVTMNEIEKVTVLTKEMSFGNKINLILAYARQYKATNPEIWKEFTEAIDKVREANSHRNDYVHATWKVGCADEAPQRWVLSLKNGKLKDEVLVVEIDELEKAAQYIYDAGQALTDTMSKVGMKSFVLDD